MDCQASKPRSVFNPFFSYDATRYDSTGRETTFRFFVFLLFRPRQHTVDLRSMPRGYFCRRRGIFKNAATVCHPSPARLHAARIYYDTPHCQEKQLLLFAQSSSHDKLSSSNQERRSTFSSISSNVIIVFHQKLDKLTVN